MVNKDVLMSRMDKLKEYVDFLETIKNHEKERYMQDPYLYGAGERFLHLAIECTIDIGNHLISDMRYRKPGSNRDVFVVLQENKVIPPELGERLADMASFRNILVHDYLKLDRGIVYDIITGNLADFKSFAAQIAGHYFG
ncbi:MAG: DUF86 domain-containing protein [Clostridia bacterium]|nr:DUF86 domain-containing protein [Clostridia bacterium]